MSSLRDILNKYNSELSENFKKEYKNKDYFYLKGQLQMSVDDIITQEKLLEAEKLDIERQKEYGGPANSFEIQSIKYQNDLFEEIKSFLKKDYYYSFFNFVLQ
jgi:transcriptional/translational regulatory protein YebC/TACO1